MDCAGVVARDREKSFYHRGHGDHRVLLDSVDALFGDLEFKAIQLGQELFLPTPLRNEGTGDGDQSDVATRENADDPMLESFVTLIKGSNDCKWQVACEKLIEGFKFR